MNNQSNDKASKKLLNEVISPSPDLLKIRNYLNEGADINYQSTVDGCTALIHAVYVENIPLIEYLLKAGANPLIKNYNKKIASDSVLRHMPIYKLLKNYELIFSVHINDISAVNTLIIEGVNINFQGAGGYTSLLIAVEQSFLEMLELLLNNGADMSIVRDDYQGVRELATEKIIFLTLDYGKPLSDEMKQKIKEQKKVNYDEIYREARLKTLVARQNQPFHLSQLQMSNYISPPSNLQLVEIEKHFGHSLPINLRSIFIHYNGAEPKLCTFGDYDVHYSISHFYRIGDDKVFGIDVWPTIEYFGSYLGSDTLPFAEDVNGSIFFLKWEDNKEKVYLLKYGEIALEGHFGDGDDVDVDVWGNNKIPVCIEPVTDSFNDFLDGLYDTN